jgi:hypothetical protein
MKEAAPLATGTAVQRIDMILTFGKFKGKRLDQVPTDYLRWMLQNCGNISPAMRDEIKFLLRDEAAPPPGRPTQTALVPPLVNKWYRELARQYHPDRPGGSHQAMVAINAGRDLLLELMEVA